MSEVFFDFLKRLLASTVPNNWDSLLLPLGKGFAASGEIYYKSSNISQSSLQPFEFFEIPRRLLLLNGADLFESRWILLNVTTNPRNLLLASLRKDLVGFIFNWCARMISNTFFRSARWLLLLQLSLLLRLSTAIIDIEFYCFMYVLMKDYIHGTLIYYPHILQSEGYYSVAVHS